MIRRRPGEFGHGNRKPPITKLQVVLDLHALQGNMSDERLNSLAGYSRDTLRRFRKGQCTDAQTLNEYAEVFGYEVRLVPIEKPRASALAAKAPT